MLLAPQKDCAITKRKWHHPWCGDDTCALGWGVGMYRGMVWAKAADHHGVAKAWSGVAAEATIWNRKVSLKFGTSLRTSTKNKMGVARLGLNS